MDQVLARAKARPASAWPAPDWTHAPGDPASLMARDECRPLRDLIFPPDGVAATDQAIAAAAGKNASDLADEERALRTDGVMVIKGGLVQWEQYAEHDDTGTRAGGYFGHPERRHPMWSASKSFTTGLIGALSALATLDPKSVPPGLEDIAARARQKPIGLDTKLGDLIDVSTLDFARFVDKGALSDPDATIADFQKRLANMAVEDFLSMNISGPAWNEGYDGNVKTSNVVGMLWLEGQRDMASYAASKLLDPATPTSRFRYSSGNAVILMRALAEVYGDLYNTLPFKALFGQLGMQSVVFERDAKQVFVGSSYAHMTLEDMARFGYAYLNGGYFGGRQVIDREFVSRARVPGKAMLAAGTVDQDFLDESAFYSLGFWTNTDFHTLAAQGKMFGPNFPALSDAEKQGKPDTPPYNLMPGSLFFPGVTTDVFFAAGHYGQNILVFPKEDLLVVRMSHDKEYFSKLGKMMQTSVACFGDDAVAARAAESMTQAEQGGRHE
jgi:CubicO group peptidase (beta-lactamase class C family)